MADALFVQILDAAVDELNTDRPSDVPEITLRRILPGEIIKEARMAVFLGNEDLDPPRDNRNADPIARRRAAFAVQCADVTDLVDDLDRIVQPMMKWATATLGKSRLGGLVHYVREASVQRQPQYGDLMSMTVNVIFEFSYQTRRDDLTVRR